MTLHATLATPPGRGGIAVVTVWGDGANDAVERIFRPLDPHSPAEGALRLGTILDGDEVIDQAIACRTTNAWEINIHGGPHVVRRLLEALKRCGSQPGAAEPATVLEHSHPKWNNPAVGAEMLAELLLVRSPLAAAAISRQWSAGLSELARGSGSADELRQAASRLRPMRRLLEPAEVVLVGAPNAGKSTLANALVGRRVSIVHERAGTTRDWVRELAVISGAAIWLTDTAGIWHAEGDIDAEAVRRAQHRAAGADLVLLLSHDGPPPGWCADRQLIRVAAKSDILPPSPQSDVTVCAVTGEGLGDLRDAILRRLGLHGLDTGAPAAFTARQQRLLVVAAELIDCGDHEQARRSLDELLSGNPVS